MDDLRAALERACDVARGEAQDSSDPAFGDLVAACVEMIAFAERADVATVPRDPVSATRYGNARTELRYFVAWPDAEHAAAATEALRRLAVRLVG